MTITERLNQFYQSGAEEMRLTSKQGQVEFIITTEYIDKYLKLGDCILEVGCGTGRYSLHYARQGYEVDAVELVQENLDIMAQNTLPTDKVRAIQGNALDLSAYENETFDITLVLGPMYHLFEEADKLQCMKEAYRVTKKGGVVYFAYTQFDPSMIQAAFGKNMYDYLVENTMLDDTTYLPINKPEAVFCLYRKDDIDELNRHFAATRLHYVGTDMFAHYNREMLHDMDEAMFERYVGYTRTICENDNLVGVSNHVLDILKKSV